MKKGSSLPINILFFGIIVSVVVLIIILVYVQENTSESDYQLSLRECSTFLHNSNGKPAYFSAKLNIPNELFFSGLSSTCPGKEYKFNKDVEEVAEAMTDCWFKSAKGVDFLPPYADDQGVCLVCGTVEIKSDSDTFSKDLEDELKKSKYSSLYDTSTSFNANTYTLSKEVLPNKVRKGENYVLVYYAYKGPIDATLDEISLSIKKWFSGLTPQTAVASYFFSSSEVETYTGVRFVKVEDSSSSNLKGVKILSDDKTQSLTDSLSCTLVVPERWFD